MATATGFSADTRPAFVEFSLLEAWLASSSALQLPLHQIESQQQAKGREVQRLLLQAHLQHRGNGDVGPALQVHQQDGEERYSHRRLGARSLTTVFGTVELVRMGYSQPGTIRRLQISAGDRNGRSDDIAAITQRAVFFLSGTRIKFARH